jgi:hypothetical protein
MDKTEGETTTSSRAMNLKTHWVGRGRRLGFALGFVLLLLLALAV